MPNLTTNTYVVIGKNEEDDHFLYYSGVEEDVAETLFDLMENTKMYTWRGGVQRNVKIKDEQILKPEAESKGFEGFDVFKSKIGSTFSEEDYQLLASLLSENEKLSREVKVQKRLHEKEKSMLIDTYEEKLEQLKNLETHYFRVKETEIGNFYKGHLGKLVSESDEGILLEFNLKEKLGGIHRVMFLKDQLLEENL